MSALQKHHIVDLFVWVDDNLPAEVKCGAKQVLSDSELLTILIWDGLCEPHKNLKAVYAWIEREYRDCFLLQGNRVLKLCDERRPIHQTILQNRSRFY